MTREQRVVALRPLTPADAAVMFEIWSDPETQRSSPLGGLLAIFDSVETTRATLASTLPATHPQAPRYLAALGQGAMVGYVCATHFAEPDLVELSWAVHPAVRRQGWGAPLVVAAIAWARTTYPAARVVADINRDNVPSIKIAVRAGMRDTGGIGHSGLPRYEAVHED